MNLIVIAHRGMGPTSTLKHADFVLPENSVGSFKPDRPSENSVEYFNADTLPENSIASFKYAFSLDADGIEFDVHVTKDSKIAVIHDDELNKKVYGADRSAKDLGKVSEHDWNDLGRYDIGNGHKIPSLKETLDLMVEENERRQKQGKSRVIIDIELKGEDSVEGTYAELKSYMDRGDLSPDDFIFNSFEWKRLKQLKEIDPRMKVVPAIRTATLFGAENMHMPGYVVKEGAEYKAEGLKALQEFHDEIDCYAFDCIVFDLRPEFIEFCKMNKVGLLTSTSKEAVKADKIKEQLALMIDAQDKLPMVCFRADNVTETNAVLKEIMDEKEAILVAQEAETQDSEGYVMRKPARYPGQ